jgi:hypothetical protein
MCCFYALNPYALVLLWVQFQVQFIKPTLWVMCCLMFAAECAALVCENSSCALMLACLLPVTLISVLQQACVLL